MDRRSCLTLTALGAAGLAGRLPALAATALPIVLYVDLSVDPAKEKDFLAAYHDHFKPVAYAGTPDFIKILIDKAHELGRNALSIKKALVSGAAFPATLRDYLQARGVNAFQAFATADIFKAVVEMRGRGMRLLAMSENYYDDLGARLGLDDAFLDQLRSHDVLYDRDADGGEFLHVYTQTFHDRFFFEVVERRGGYDLYGAANAPVRMAAQSRAVSQSNQQI